jgi:hypothetical protein
LRYPPRLTCGDAGPYHQQRVVGLAFSGRIIFDKPDVELFNLKIYNFDVYISLLRRLCQPSILFRVG